MKIVPGSREHLQLVDEWQAERQEMFRQVSPKGVKTEWLGKPFILFKDVFWPFYDNPLLEKMPNLKGQTALDVGTGSGVIAIFLAYAGVSKVLAVDINPAAVACAKENAKLNGFERVIEVRQSDAFSNVKDEEKFDVITANLPFRNKHAKDFVESTMWDDGLRTHEKFFKGAGSHLNEKGRIYLNQSNFGAVDEMKSMAEQEGFTVKLVAKRTYEEGEKLYPCEFYAFELKKKN